MRRDVFQAIADPTRRQIIGVIAGHSLTMNAVAESFGMSRQAVAKHIGILTECGLIVIKQNGRERYCEANLARLNDVAVWVAQYKQFYEAHLDSLENYLNKLQSKNKKNAKRKK